MDISVELTLTPLKDDYEYVIKDFIKSLRKSEFKIIETPLSTQIYGNYKELMSFLNDNIYHTFCLLYTSPSPRDRTRSRMPSSA